MDKVLLVFEDYTDLMHLESIIRKLGFDSLGTTSEASLSDQIVSFNPGVVMAYGKGAKVSSLRVARKLRDMTRWQGKVLVILPAGQKISPDELPDLRMDLVIEAPYKIEEVLQVLARFSSFDEEMLLHKYQTQSNLENKKEFRIASESTDTMSEFRVQGNELNPGMDSQFVSSHSFELKSTKIDRDNHIHQADEKIFPISENEEDAEPSDIMKEIDASLKTDSKRVKGYKEFIQDLVLAPRSTINRNSARLAQNKLRKSFNISSLESQDEQRREFTRALFKKNR